MLTKLNGSLPKLLWNLKTSCCNKFKEFRSDMGGWKVEDFDGGS